MCLYAVKNHLLPQLRNWSRRLTWKECTRLPSINCTSQSSLRGNYGTLSLLRIQHAPIFFCQLHTVSRVVSCISVCPLFSSAVKVVIPTTFNHILQFGSAQLCLVQCRQRVGLLLCTTTREGAISLKSARLCECVCVYVCTCVCIPDRPTDPQDCCPPGLPAYQAENAVQYCLTDSVPQAASVKRWWLDTTAPQSGCLRSLTVSWLVSSSPCMCHHTTARWPKEKTQQE